MPYQIHPDPIWKQLGIPSLKEQIQEKYGLKNTIAPYSGPRGHPVTLREEADAYKWAVRAQNATARSATIKSGTAPNSPKSKIQQPVKQAVLKSTNTPKRKSTMLQHILHKILCIPYYGPISK
jgi:hypothetical protein